MEENVAEEMSGMYRDGRAGNEKERMEAIEEMEEKAIRAMLEPEGR